MIYIIGIVICIIVGYVCYQVGKGTAILEMEKLLAIIEINQKIEELNNTINEKA